MTNTNWVRCIVALCCWWWWWSGQGTYFSRVFHVRSSWSWQMLLKHRTFRWVNRPYYVKVIMSHEILKKKTPFSGKYRTIIWTQPVKLLNYDKLRPPLPLPYACKPMWVGIGFVWYNNYIYVLTMYLYYIILCTLMLNKIHTYIHTTGER